jgi:hypothetical protein
VLSSRWEIFSSTTTLPDVDVFPYQHFHLRGESGLDEVLEEPMYCTTVWNAGWPMGTW